MERETVRELLLAELEQAEGVASQQRTVLGGSHDDLFDELNSVDQHQADSASDTYEREQALTILQLAESRVAAVETALEKVDAGTYGTCELCGAAILDERLEAVPDTRFCEPHERDAELHRIGMRVDAAVAGAADYAEPGWGELDELPDDDDLEPRQPARSAEELAMHVEESSDRRERYNPCLEG